MSESIETSEMLKIKNKVETRGVKKNSERNFKHLYWELFFVSSSNKVIHKKFSTTTQILRDDDFSWLHSKNNINYYAKIRPNLNNESSLRKVGLFKVSKIKELIVK